MVDTTYLRKNYTNSDNDLAKQLGEVDTKEEELKVGSKMMEENYFKYHENMANYDPKGQPYSYFYITVMGQIEYGEFTSDMDGLQAHYSFVTGEDWGVADGITAGVGQYAFKG